MPPVVIPGARGHLGAISLCVGVGEIPQGERMRCREKRIREEVWVPAFNGQINDNGSSTSKGGRELGGEPEARNTLREGFQREAWPWALGAAERASVPSLNNVHWVCLESH